MRTDEILRLVANNSNDPNTKVGALAINTKTDVLIKAGYNRTKPTINVEEQTIWKGDGDLYVHAEENLLNRLLALEIDPEITKIILSRSPCNRCVDLLNKYGFNNVEYIALNPHCETWKYFTTKKEFNCIVHKPFIINLEE